MSIETETMKVLELVKEGKLSAEDAAKLLHEMNRETREPDREADLLKNIRCQGG